MALSRKPGKSCGRLVVLAAWAAVAVSACPSPGKPRANKRGAGPKAARPAAKLDFESLRLAVRDLTDTFGPRYPDGPAYLRRLDELRRQAAGLGAAAAGGAKRAELAAKLQALRSEALLANPLLKFDRLLVLKRRRGQLGLPVNHKCNAGIEQTGYDNEIAVLSPVRPGGELRTLYRPASGEFVGEMDLHWDADRLLFTMPAGGAWHVWEVRSDGGGLRRVCRGEHGDVDNFDACYLPDGRIVYASTASYTAVPCWHGKERACNIYRMDADGGGVRQLCFDQDLDLHPAVLGSGQVIFSRWDYSGPMHMYLRPLMLMNPDGTGQRAAYGSNSYWPNALYFPQGIPGAPGRIVAIVAGYHGVPRMGELAVLDTTRGWEEADGVVQRIPGRGKPIETVIRDKLVDKSWPKFLHPFPLSDPAAPQLAAGRYFLVASQLSAKAPWGIYLVDVFDNIVPVCVDGRYDFFEPIPLQARPRPPIIPDRVDLSRGDAVVYLHDVYKGPGLAGVPRGTIKRLRVAAYRFGYPGLAGPDKIGCGGPWEAMRIYGTVPVHEDGSAMFRVPARVPLTIQPLDAEGKAVQLMRSWFTAMPGEAISCVGCHEQPREAPESRYKLAATRKPDEIAGWYGPPRGFDFEREVQPVLDRYCVACHDGKAAPDGHGPPDLRAERFRKDYRGMQLSGLGAGRLHPDARRRLGGTAVRYTPAYEALIPYVRRVNVEDDVHLLAPGEYHADTSELIQMLRKGHRNVRLDREAWDRLVTWIDLNGPCHGDWSDVLPGRRLPEGADRRRLELSRLYGGPANGADEARPGAAANVEPILPDPLPAAPREAPTAAGWPFDAAEARRRQRAAGPHEKTIDLGGGQAIKLVRIPAGEFVMGSTRGEPDERPLARVAVRKAFWIGVCEVTNAQFRRFDPAHNSGRFAKRFDSRDGPGLSVDGADQPATRVSCERAEAFCRWLSARTHRKLALPTEAQWEYACRAGSAGDLSYGDVAADFSAWANVADKALNRPPSVTGGLGTNIRAFGAKDFVCDARFDDGAVATAKVGSHGPNAWGLFDVHGNVCEWTRSAYRPYPYAAGDGRNAPGAAERRVVRGGSWVDRPERCRSAFRLSYRPWRRVFNVGFRVVCESAAD